MTIRAVFAKFETNQAFTENEAWGLFKIAAFAEAVGWTLLITGIVLEHLTGSHAYVAVAGRIHGTLFFGYMAAAGLYPNLRWNRWQALIALLASVPPYGSLIFEQLASYQRRTNHAKVYRNIMTLHAITSRP